MTEPRSPEGCIATLPDGTMIKLTPVYDGFDGEIHHWVLTGAEGKISSDRMPRLHFDVLPGKTSVSILIGIEEDDQGEDHERGPDGPGSVQTGGL